MESRVERTDADALLPVTVGTGIWLVILIGLLLRRPSVEDSGHGWWIGVAAVGFGLGLMGIVFLRWRRGRMDRRAS